jgi:hypothetical protein
MPRRALNQLGKAHRASLLGITMAGSPAVWRVSIKGTIMASRRSNSFGAAAQTTKDEKPDA